MTDPTNVSCPTLEAAASAQQSIITLSDQIKATQETLDTFHDPLNQFYSPGSTVKLSQSAIEIGVRAFVDCLADGIIGKLNNDRFGICGYSEVALLIGWLARWKRLLSTIIDDTLFARGSHHWKVDGTQLISQNSIMTFSAAAASVGERQLEETS
ncbi:hypothetical protein N7540_013066 [Penicillium herquei]|nr:hypothetical protein N7540_013066 [Penicillium herquei]